MTGEERKVVQRRLSLVALASLLGGGPGLAPGAELAAVADGQFGEWDGIAPAHVDPVGDAFPIDFGQLWVGSNSEYVTLRLEVGAEINLQNHNSITLFLDGDHDPETGCSREGLGAEVIWRFGQRGGVRCRDGVETRISHADWNLETAPTVSSPQFEVSFRRFRRDGTPLLPGPAVSLVIRDESAESGDRLPDGNGVVDLVLSDEPPPVRPPASLDRRHPDDLRIVTWNVRFDGLFRRPASFRRVLKALDPDVICFQEIWSHTSRQSADQVSLAIPESDWYAASAVEGHVVSRYPFHAEASIDEAGNYWAWIDLPDDRYAADLSIVNGHPPCCEKEQRRQDQLDGMVAWIRDLRSPGGFEAPDRIPTVITGDLNLVGGARQLRTVQAGEISNEQTYGPSFALDWDQTPLADADPRRTNGASVATWRNHEGSYSPGKLDYILYSDSVMQLHNRFILDTETLSAEMLAAYGLRLDDTRVASDHLPVVADFTLVAEPVGAAAGE